MAKAREIQRRIKAVGNIQRITKTMKMIATARFQASQKNAMAAKPYTQKIGELVGELAASAGGEAGAGHPLLRAPEPATGRRLLLVLTSNRGLCGAYNGNILRKANGYLRDHAEEGVDLEVVGKKGVAYFRFNKIDVARVHSQFDDKPQYDQVNVLAQRYMDAFSAGVYDSVDVVYMAFESMSRQRAVAQQLLPLADPTAASETQAEEETPAWGPGLAGPAVVTPQVDYEFSPAPAELLADLLPASVKTQLFQCFIEAVVSEQISRMIAMTAATDNAVDMNRTLTRTYNRVRQAAITTELTEIIGGAAAL